MILGLDGAMATRVETAEGALLSHSPTRLFAGRYFVGGASAVGRTHAPSADGRRFLMV